MIHWPVKLKPWASDMVPKEDEFDELDLETTWNHMEKCVDLGLTKTIGVEMHLMWRQRKLREVCSSKNVHVTAYSPLGSPWNPYGLKNLLQHPIVHSIASKHEATPAQVALRWILSMGASAVVKSFNESRLEENMASFALKLDEQDLQEIDKLEEKKMATGEFLVNATTSQYKNIQELWDGEI
ncbi:aldo-keto reductase family 4 member C9-like [Cucumis melo var. makuwa]|uniref:Aldo-keto reductase family 4 member C9-like n=1 Tax=Cucumis melo var. makuwa TaxID=1194695 RepID=A0A5D3BLM0_CUCMM|nr:aldo-keto reductase family 4 member C9-like [Cucumis melo var. makuwa]